MVFLTFVTGKVTRSVTAVTCFFKVPFVTAAHRGVAWQHGGDAIVVLLSIASIVNKDDSMLTFSGSLDLATLEVVHYINQLGTG